MQKGLSSNTVGQWLVEKNHPAIEKLFVINSFEKFVSVSEKKKKTCLAKLTIKICMRNIICSGCDAGTRTVLVAIRMPYHGWR